MSTDFYLCKKHIEIMKDVFVDLEFKASCKCDYRDNQYDFEIEDTINSIEFEPYMLKNGTEIDLFGLKNNDPFWQKTQFLDCDDCVKKVEEQVKYWLDDNWQNEKLIKSSILGVA